MGEVTPIRRPSHSAFPGGAALVSRLGRAPLRADAAPRSLTTLYRRRSPSRAGLGRPCAWMFGRAETALDLRTKRIELRMAAARDASSPAPSAGCAAHGSCCARSVARVAADAERARDGRPLHAGAMQLQDVVDALCVSRTIASSLHAQACIHRGAQSAQGRAAARELAADNRARRAPRLVNERSSRPRVQPRRQPLSLPRHRPPAPRRACGAPHRLRSTAAGRPRSMPAPAPGPCSGAARADAAPLRGLPRAQSSLGNTCVTASWLQARQRASSTARRRRHQSKRTLAVSSSERLSASARRRQTQLCAVSTGMAICG